MANPNFYLNGFNIGTNISLTIQDSYGDVFTAADLGNLMSVDVSFDLQQIKITPITDGGVPKFVSIPNGLSGSMEFVRQNGNLTSMFTTLYAAFYNQGLLPNFTMNIDVLNPTNDTLDTYTFPGIVFHNPDFGRFAEISEVRQRLSFSGPTIISTSNLSNILAGVPT